MVLGDKPSHFSADINKSSTITDSGYLTEDGGGMSIRERVYKIHSLMNKQKNARFGKAWALWATKLRFPPEEWMDISWDDRYTKEWWEGMKWSEKNERIYRGWTPAVVETTRAKTWDILLKINHTPQEDKKPKNPFTVLGRNNVSYLYWVKGKQLFLQEAEELLVLCEMYEHCWLAYDSEWKEYLRDAFWEYLEKEHRFFILYSDYRCDYTWECCTPENIVGFMRATPYKDSVTDPYAEYLWAVNIERPFHGYGLTKYLLQDFFDNSPYCNEVYLHAIVGSSAQTSWERLWFQTRGETVDLEYGKKGRKMPMALMCLTRREFEKSGEKAI